MSTMRRVGDMIVVTGALMVVFAMVALAIIVEFFPWMVAIVAVWWMVTQ